MKSIFFSALLAVLGLLPAVSVRGQQTDLPWISPGSDAAGKQGYYDNSGRCIIPCLFDYASPFRDGEQITTVRYAGKYYLIDRAGNMILLEGFDFMPDVYRRFATVLRKLDTGYEYALIDLYGQRISPEGVSAAPLRGAPETEDPVLFSMGNGECMALADINFQPLSALLVQDLCQDSFCPEAIVYRIGDNHYGVMNADGEVLIEERKTYGGVQILRITDTQSYRKWLREAGMYDLYTEEELNEVFLVIFTVGDKASLFDITGQPIAATVKSGPEYDIIRRSFKKYIVPYLRHKAENRARFEEKLLEPYARRQAVYRELPEKTLSQYSIAAYIREREAPKPASQNAAPVNLASTPSSTKASTAAGDTSSQVASTSRPTPAAGSIPLNRDLCYANPKGRLISVYLTQGELGTFIRVFPLTGYSYPRFILSGETADCYEFSSFSLAPRSIYRPDAGFNVYISKLVLTVSKDWKKIRMEDGTVYDIPITNEQFSQAIMRSTLLMEGYYSGGYWPQSTPINADQKSEFRTNRHGYYTCPNCHGSGRCPHCSHGIARNAYLGGDPMICGVCHGRGCCQSCDGTGKLYGVIH